jgi:hypothetical protein
MEESSAPCRSILLFAFFPLGVIVDFHELELAQRAPDAPTRRLARALASALGLGAALNMPATAFAGSTFIVNTAGDPGNPGTLSLRQAVALAQPFDTVQFDGSLAGSTITLATGAIAISHGLTIQGLGRDRLTISGADTSRIFQLSCPSPGPIGVVGISSLTLSHGYKSYGEGGALFSYRCELHLSDVRVTASHAVSGGGILFDNGTISNSVVSGCEADALGGGIYVRWGPGVTNIYRSTIESNSAVTGGGGVFLQNTNNGSTGAYTLISKSTINNNRVTATTGPQYGGGGIGVHHSTLTLRYSTVYQNTAYSSGGGISFADLFSAHTSVVIRSTVSLNAAQKTPGNGLYSPSGKVVTTYSIIADNFNKYGLTDLSGTFGVYSSLVQSPGDSTISGNNSLFGFDPDLGKLDDNGGPTKTMLPNQGSPAIDAITHTFAQDQRSLPGVVNVKADMGSVERQIPEVIIFRDGFDPG